MSEDSTGEKTFFSQHFLPCRYISFLRFYPSGPRLPLSTHFFYTVLLTFLKGLGTLESSLYYLYLSCSLLSSFFGFLKECSKPFVILVKSINKLFA